MYHSRTFQLIQGNMQIYPPNDSLFINFVLVRKQALRQAQREVGKEQEILGNRGF